MIKNVLSIAGSDSSAGAGVQADLKTFSALNVYGASVITALTAQNTQRITSVLPISDDFVSEQLRAVFEDLDIAAVKIGMLANKSIIKAVAKTLQRYKPKIIILDPVMASETGHDLLSSDAIQVLKHELFPLVDLITPNVKEAALLLGEDPDMLTFVFERYLGLRESNNEAKETKLIKSLKDVEDVKRKLLALGANSVLLTGGHFYKNKCADFLFVQDVQDNAQNTIQDHIKNEAAKNSSHISTSKIFISPRIDTKNNHGTGCTLSSAVTTFLAQGYTIEDSILRAKGYVYRSLMYAKKLSVGKGSGPLHHNYQWSENKSHQQFIEDNVLSEEIVVSNVSEIISQRKTSLKRAV